jgi:N-glycosylase/DNA lyase
MKKINIDRHIKELERTPLSRIIRKRLNEFESFKRKTAQEWFSELCFCLLTANSKAKTAIQIQQELGAEGFCKGNATKIRNCIIKNKHRFHNNKTNFILNAREHLDVKDKITFLVKKKGELEAREWLVKNVKGLGYKESSHFLRNVGYKSLAILDRHIINLMHEHRLIGERPKTLNKKNYLVIEKKLKKVANKVEMTLAELDLYMWHMKTGEVLK